MDQSKLIQLSNEFRQVGSLRYIEVIQRYYLSKEDTEEVLKELYKLNFGTAGYAVITVNKLMNELFKENKIRSIYGKKVTSYLFDLANQLKMESNPSFTFEMLDRIGVTYRAQNEIQYLVECSDWSNNQIVNYMMQRTYLYRFEESKDAYVKVLN